MQFRKLTLFVAIAFASGIVVFGTLGRNGHAQSSATEVNLTGMWIMEYENGKKGWMSIVYQPNGPNAYTGRISLPDYGETDIKSATARGLFKLGSDIIFTPAGLAGKGYFVQWVIFDKIASSSMAAGKIMSGHGGLLPGNTSQIKFMATRG
jgi:hypothetical protein